MTYLGSPHPRRPDWVRYVCDCCKDTYFDRLLTAAEHADTDRKDYCCACRGDWPAPLPHASDAAAAADREYPMATKRPSTKKSGEEADEDE